MKAKEIMKKYNITRKTLSNWVINNKILYNILPNGRYDYENVKNENVDKINIIYARVSTTNQKENLDRQLNRLEDYCAKNGFIINKTYKEIASGMNYNRKYFNIILDMILENKIENIFIEYEDRLVRFGFDNILNICKKFNTNIIIINENENKDTIKEITDDLVNIIHHFSSKIYSLRKNKNKLLNIIKDDNN